MKIGMIGLVAAGMMVAASAANAGYTWGDTLAGTHGLTGTHGDTLAGTHGLTGTHGDTLAGTHGLTGTHGDTLAGTHD